MKELVPACSREQGFRQKMKSKVSQTAHLDGPRSLKVRYRRREKLGELLPDAEIIVEPAADEFISESFVEYSVVEALRIEPTAPPALALVMHAVSPGSSEAKNMPRHSRPSRQPCSCFGTRRASRISPPRWSGPKSGPSFQTPAL